MATPMDRLIQQYNAEAYKLQKYQKSLDLLKPQEAEEAEIVSGMLSDLRYALEWMRRGRRPGNRRGVERTDIYRQREIYAEIQPIQAHDHEQLVLLLLNLSTRERTCFLLHMAHGLTYEEISARLLVSRATVQSYVIRAKDKLKQEIS